MLKNPKMKQAMKPAEKAMQSQKNFIAAVSHELRRPLASPFPHAVSALYYSMEKLFRTAEKPTKIIQLSFPNRYYNSLTQILAKPT